MRQRPDGKAEDGHFNSGLRWVRKGGWVKAGGYWFQDDALLPYVDVQISVLVDDYWLTAILCHDPYKGEHICKAYNKKRKEKTDAQ